MLKKFIERYTDFVYIPLIIAETKYKKEHFV